MIAASAPENGPLSPAEPPWDINEAASGDAIEDARRPEPAAPAPVIAIPVPPSSGDRGECGRASAIIGEAEAIDPRLEPSGLLCKRRTMKKTRIPPATRAKKPRMTMTAMAQ